MIRSCSILPCILLGTCLVQAQDFEGQFIQRITTIGSDDLYEIVGDGLYADDPSSRPALLMELDVDALSETESAEVERLRILIHGEMTRVQQEGPGDPQGYQIVNARTGTIWMVNVPERSYVEFTKEAAEEVEARAREMMEKMGVNPDELGDADEYNVEPGSSESTGREAVINGVRATAFAYWDDDRTEVAWCADDYSDFFKAMQQHALASAFADEDDDEESVGVECPDGIFPVRTLSYDVYGQSLVVEDLVDVKAESVPTGLFEVPSGFTRKDFMDGFFGR